MMCEEVKLDIDIERLSHQLEMDIFQYESTWNGKKYGLSGWSVTSANGHHKDGWYKNIFDNVDGTQVFNSERARAQGWSPPAEHTIPTEICTGYIAEVVATLSKMYPRVYRVRISTLQPGGEMGWHRDAPEGVRKPRLHVPIITNPYCLFSYKDEAVSFSMSANGSGFLVDVSKLHRVTNAGSMARYHLLMDVDLDRNAEHTIFY